MERLRKHTTIFYSTHILEDVQRVSDTVVILNKGQLVAQGPIEELMSGKGGLVYSMTLTGDEKCAQDRIAAQPWGIAVSVISCAFLYAFPSWRIRSTWMGIIVHSLQSMYFGFLIPGIVLGLA